MRNIAKMGSSFTRENILAATIFWGLFFGVCGGLGYSTLNRYDTRKVLPDAAVYSALVTDGPSAVDGYFRFRLLEPVLVRRIYLLASGRVGSWDALAFGFLVANSLFVASTALLLLIVGSKVTGSHSIALVGSLLYLLNFAVSNTQLAGLVDAGESFFIMAMFFSMYFSRWALLPLLGILGALTKETFVPFSMAIAITWIYSEKPSSNQLGRIFWIISMVVAELITVTVAQSSISGQLTLPWGFALALNSHSNHGRVFFESLVDKDSWYVLVWLMPLGLPQIKKLPRPWAWATISGVVVALLLNAYHSLPGFEGAVGRYVFNLAGPILSLSAAIFLCRNRIQQIAQ